MKNSFISIFSSLTLCLVSVGSFASDRGFVSDGKVEYKIVTFPRATTSSSDLNNAFKIIVDGLEQNDIEKKGEPP